MRTIKTPSKRKVFREIVISNRHERLLTGGMYFRSKSRKNQINKMI